MTSATIESVLNTEDGTRKLKYFLDQGITNKREITTAQEHIKDMITDLSDSLGIEKKELRKLLAVAWKGETTEKSALDIIEEERNGTDNTEEVLRRLGRL